MAAPSPLAQSHPAPSPPRSDAGSDSEDETAPVQQLQTKLQQLALVEEVEVDLEGLTALSPEVISKQATINIGQSLLLEGEEREAV